MESKHDSLWELAQELATNGAIDQAKETLTELVASAKKAKDDHHHIFALNPLGKITLMHDGDIIASYNYLISASR